MSIIVQEEYAMGSKIAKIIKMIAIIIWVLGLIAGISAGLAGTSPYSYYYDRSFNSFNILNMLLIWVVFFIAGIFYFAFGELLDNVVALRKNAAEQLRLMSRNQNTSPPIMPAANPHASSEWQMERSEYPKREMKRPENGFIICPHCGQLQDDTNHACPVCGARFID